MEKTTEMLNFSREPFAKLSFTNSQELIELLQLAEKQVEQLNDTLSKINEFQMQFKLLET